MKAKFTWNLLVLMKCKLFRENYYCFSTDLFLCPGKNIIKDKGWSWDSLVYHFCRQLAFAMVGNGQFPPSKKTSTLREKWTKPMNKKFTRLIKLKLIFIKVMFLCWNSLVYRLADNEHLQRWALDNFHPEKKP